MDTFPYTGYSLAYIKSVSVFCQLLFNMSVNFTSQIIDKSTIYDTNTPYTLFKIIFYFQTPILKKTVCTAFLMPHVGWWYVFVCDIRCGERFSKDGNSDQHSTVTRTCAIPNCLLTIAMYKLWHYVTNKSFLGTYFSICNGYRDRRLIRCHSFWVLVAACCLFL
jgi:hypothetical protein